MADKIRILYFLEDIAQEGFITALVRRVASDESIASGSLDHDIRSARGGSKVTTEFRKFLKDTERGQVAETDFLVVAVDGNCQGYEERVKRLKKCIKSNHPFNGRVVYAVPDPHIERWYLMDQRAIKAGIGLNRAPDLPTYKCEKDYYKQMLRQALRESNVNSLLGGVEYSERIVDNIQRLESLSQQDAGFGIFVRDLRRMLRNKLDSSA